MSKPQYKIVYTPVQLRPEFLDWYAKRQAELYMKIQAIDDEIAHNKLPSSTIHTYTSPLIFIGALLGAIVGLLIASTL